VGVTLRAIYERALFAGNAPGVCPG
jgi:hypothetical protein